METITALACQYARELSRAYNERTGYPGYPPDVDHGDAVQTLELLCERIGERNFREVCKRWEAELIPGIDL